MPLALWIGDGNHFFVDTFLECEVQVGQAYQKSDGSWIIEVNDENVEGARLISMLPSVSSSRSTIGLLSS